LNNLAKQIIQEKYNLKVCGILNLEDMSVEGEFGVRDIKDLLSKVNGEEIVLNVTKTEEID